MDEENVLMLRLFFGNQSRIYGQTMSTDQGILVGHCSNLLEVTSFRRFAFPRLRENVVIPISITEFLLHENASDGCEAETKRLGDSF
jgi:hypothetical protein